MKNSRALLVFILVFFLIQAFCVRYAAFKRGHPTTFDEGVYARMGGQMLENLTDYNTQRIYKEVAEKGRSLPERYNKPLFVHPPLFSFLISISYRIFGRVPDAAFFVSAFAGLLLIVLAYLLGTAVFEERVGILAALLMSIEPITWLCSQRVWMETTLAFFMLLALYLFYRGIKDYKSQWMLWGGVAAGLAALTKYPGFLVVLFMPLYALCCEKWLLKKKKFWLCLCIPFLMFLPWILWNCSVYGAEGLDLFIHNPTGTPTSHFYGNLKTFLLKYWWLVSLGVIGGAFLVVEKLKSQEKNENQLNDRRRKVYQTLLVLVFLTLVIMLRGYIVNAFRLKHVPEYGWRRGMFIGEPRHFYLGRIMELSPLYVLSYLGLIVCMIEIKKAHKQYALIFLFTGMVLAFFTAWAGNFQCRYLVSASVPLMILAARTQVYVFDQVQERVSGKGRIALLCVLGLVPAYFVLKTLMIAFAMALPNNACYF